MGIFESGLEESYAETMLRCCHAPPWGEGGCIWSRMTDILKILRTCLGMVVTVGILSLAVAWFRHGVWLRYVFQANFAVGIVVVLAALVVLFMPVFMPRGDKLLDHSTYSERVLEEREKKRIRAYNMLYVGIGQILLTAILELVAWLLL